MIRDQLNRELDIKYLPVRVISLVPSITELLLDLGLGERLVGRTKFCIHPTGQVKSVFSVGGTKNVRHEAVKKLNPDFIIANKEENTKECIESLSKDFPVFISDVKGLESAIELISSLASILGLDSEELISRIHHSARDLESKSRQLGNALYLIWNKPFMAAGSDTFINSMLTQAGFKNAVSAHRYPELTASEIVLLNPEIILLSSEPFPFNEAHLNEIQDKFPKSMVKLVDGEMFSWYGSRMAKAYEYMISEFYSGG